MQLAALAHSFAPLSPFLSSPLPELSPSMRRRVKLPPSVPYTPSHGPLILPPLMGLINVHDSDTGSIVESIEVELTESRLGTSTTNERERCATNARVVATPPNSLYLSCLILAPQHRRIWIKGGKNVRKGQGGRRNLLGGGGGDAFGDVEGYGDDNVDEENVEEVSE